MVGSNLASEALNIGFKVSGRSLTNLDFRDRNVTFAELGEIKPSILIIATAIVGGKVANCEFIS
jgi:hypothetical protein